MASDREIEWWNRFAHVMARQWNLTPRLNRWLRAEYERDYEACLWSSGGKLLDVGCGTGFRTHRLAARGMEVDGIDVSAEQLAIAEAAAGDAGLRSMAFFQRDLLRGPWHGRFLLYDAALVNALVHHLSYDEAAIAFQRLAEVIRPGGRVYLYEPLVQQWESAWRYGLFQAFDVAWRAGLATFWRAGRLLRAFDDEFVAAFRQGYDGTSPDEHAVDLERLRRAVDPHFRITSIRPVHEYSLAYAMSIMLLKPGLRRPLEPLVPLMYRLDRSLFRLGLWENAGTTNRWILCAVKLERR